MVSLFNVVYYVPFISTGIEEKMQNCYCPCCCCKPLLLLILLLSCITSRTSGVVAFSASTSISLLANTRWKLRLDVGLEPGTWMPKRFPGWAESGARLGLDVTVEFSLQENNTERRESLLGPGGALVAKVCSTEPFVSERGQEQVIFSNTGGWSVQRPQGDIKNSAGGLVNPEGLLRFWLDCESGAKRKDVEIPPKTRIFFSTGIWDDPVAIRPDQLKAFQSEYQETVDAMNKLLDQTRQKRRTETSSSWFKELRSYPDMLNDSKEFDRLKSRKETLEKTMPPPNAAVGSNGVRIAPKGSLVIKGNSIPDWLPGSEYLILGTFSVRPQD